RRSRGDGARPDRQTDAHLTRRPRRDGRAGVVHLDLRCLLCILPPFASFGRQGMNRRVVGAVLALAAIYSVSGCGSFLNIAYFTPIEGGGRMYGGVSLDAEEGTKYIRKTFSSDPAQDDGPDKSKPVMLALGVYFLAIDLPLSAVADTLALPWTIRA